MGTIAIALPLDANGSSGRRPDPAHAESVTSAHATRLVKRKEDGFMPAVLVK
jgi:hypothetical protein